MESLGFPVSMLDGRTFTACKNVFFRVYLNIPDARFFSALDALA